MLLRAFAKINWSLDITGVRPDGYHLMDMIMQPVSLCDEIELTPAPDLSLFTDGNPPSRADETNLAWRAADLLRKTCGIREGVRNAQLFMERSTSAAKTLCSPSAAFLNPSLWTR
jgi:4-diphosphocytidyl-2-C-methyl-D-erythritol kinase